MYAFRTNGICAGNAFEYSVDYLNTAYSRVPALYTQSETGWYTGGWASGICDVRSVADCAQVCNAVVGFLCLPTEPGPWIEAIVGHVRSPWHAVQALCGPCGTACKRCEAPAARRVAPVARHASPVSSLKHPMRALSPDQAQPWDTPGPPPWCQPGAPYSLWSLWVPLKEGACPMKHPARRQTW